MLTTRICAAWLLKHIAHRSYPGKPEIFMSGRCSSTPSLRSLGRGFLVRTRFSTSAAMMLPRLDAPQQNAPWKMRRTWTRTHLKLCLLWVIINTACLLIIGSPKARFVALGKCYPAAATCHTFLAELPDARDSGIKVLLTQNKLSAWTHVMWSYSKALHGHMPRLNNSALL